MIQGMWAIWSLIPLTFLNPTCTSGSSWFTYCWSLTWRILCIILLACEMSAAVPQFECSLALPFFGIRMNTDLFQSCGHCWVFQICWRVECCTLAASHTLSLQCMVCTFHFVTFPLALNYDHVFMTIACTFWIASVKIYSFIWMNCN